MQTYNKENYERLKLFKNQAAHSMAYVEKLINVITHVIYCQLSMLPTNQKIV